MSIQTETLTNRLPVGSKADSRPRSGLRAFFDQPRAVWAVAFAAVVAFMGIGLVDPILPALAAQLNASPSQVELLFTSYFLVTGVAMLITGWVSSRIGAKRTILAGLAIIVAFSAAAGLSSSIAEIVAFRGVWGLGNALFIATALTAIVAAASGGLRGAIILYEAALGLGIACGPLLGGLLGGISWRGPFFGTAALMAMGFVAISTLLDKTPAPATRQPLREPFAALANPGLRALAGTALLYNFGFFTLLAYTPFPLRMGIHELGLVFFGWGLLLAVASVFVAPRLQERIGTLPSLYVGLGLTAGTLAVMGLGVNHQVTLAAAVIVAGLFLGIVNTVLTEKVMDIGADNRAATSSAYSFVRFAGGGIAPFLAGKMAEHVSVQLPFYVGAVSVAMAVAFLYSNRRHLSETHVHHPLADAATAEVLTAGDLD
ncbi:MAG: MFS transporter [Gaiellales bacterium]